VTPLDEHSFPSGHCMTMAAVFVPLGLALPQLIFVLGIVAFLIGWARLAAAHHYPSDLVSGAALGAAIALPISWALAF
jgi:undecaprenyl-diphosphatase